MNQILYNFIYEKINYNYVREGINVDLCSEFNINVYLDLFLAGNDKTNKQNERYYTTEGDACDASPIDAVSEISNELPLRWCTEDGRDITDTWYINYLAHWTGQICGLKKERKEIK